MSVLIRGMKMPENCVGCPLAKNYGMCAITKKTFNWGNPNRLSDCPLIEILPHGRLIDADVLDIRRREQQAWQDYERNLDNEYLEGVKDGLHEASKQLSTAMTIIEAEEEHE